MIFISWHRTVVKCRKSGAGRPKSNMVPSGSVFFGWSKFLHYSLSLFSLILEKRRSDLCTAIFSDANKINQNM